MTVVKYLKILAAMIAFSALLGSGAYSASASIISQEYQQLSTYQANDASSQSIGKVFYDADINNDDDGLLGSSEKENSSAKKKWTPTTQVYPGAAGALGTFQQYLEPIAINYSYHFKPYPQNLRKIYAFSPPGRIEGSSNVYSAFQIQIFKDYNFPQQHWLPLARSEILAIHQKFPSHFLIFDFCGSQMQITSYSYIKREHYKIA